MKVLSRVLFVLGILTLLLFLTGFLLTAHLSREYGVPAAAVQNILSLGGAWGLDRDGAMNLGERVGYFLSLRQGTLLCVGLAALALGTVLALARRSAARRMAHEAAPPQPAGRGEAGGPSPMEDGALLPPDRQAWRRRPPSRDQAYPAAEAPSPKSRFPGHQTPEAPVPLEPPQLTRILICLLGEHQGVSVRAEAMVLGDGCFIGRDTACQVVFSERSVSRKHCVLWVEDSRLWIKNLSETNPLRVNGRVADEGALELRSGDGLTLGLLELKILF